MNLRVINSDLCVSASRSAFTRAKAKVWWLVVSAPSPNLSCIPLLYFQDLLLLYWVAVQLYLAPKAALSVHPFSSALHLHLCSYHNERRPPHCRFHNTAPVHLTRHLPVTRSWDWLSNQTRPSTCWGQHKKIQTKLFTGFHPQWPFQTDHCCSSAVNIRASY